MNTYQSVAFTPLYCWGPTYRLGGDQSNYATTVNSRATVWFSYNLKSGNLAQENN